MTAELAGMLLVHLQRPPSAGALRRGLAGRGYWLLSHRCYFNLISNRLPETLSQLRSPALGLSPSYSLR